MRAGPLPENANETEKGALRGALPYCPGDYGKVFDLELPEEAEDAIPMEELEESMQT